MGAGDPKKKSTVPVRARPDSPAGGGGPGHFRDADSFRADEKRWDTVRHAKAPAGRLEVATAADAASGAVKKSKAPKTKPFTKQIASQSGSEITLDVRVQVLADTMNDDTVERPSSADTRYETSPGLNEFASASYKTMDGKITAFTKKLVVRGSYIIRTHYRPGASPNDDSEYGRGTTPTDKASGNVTLGFHESCHRDEYVDYLTSKPYPKFTGKVGMTEEQFSTAVDEFADAVKAFNAGLDALGPAVDEVGDCPKADWETGKCP